MREFSSGPFLGDKSERQVSSKTIAISLICFDSRDTVSPENHDEIRPFSKILTILDEQTSVCGKRPSRAHSSQKAPIFMAFVPYFMPLCADAPHAQSVIQHERDGSNDIHSDFVTTIPRRLPRLLPPGAPRGEGRSAGGAALRMISLRRFAFDY